MRSEQRGSGDILREMDRREGEGLRYGEDGLDGMTEEGHRTVDGRPGPSFAETCDVEDAGGDSYGCAGDAACEGELDEEARDRLVRDLRLGEDWTSPQYAFHL